MTAAQNNPQFSSPSSVSIGSPEIKAGLPAEASAEAGEIEVIEIPEVPPELAEHVKKVIQGEVELPGPLNVGNYEGHTLSIKPSAPQQPNIILPLTKQDFTVKRKTKVADAFSWLWLFVKRIIQMYPGRTIYRME